VEGCGEAQPPRTRFLARGGQAAWRNPHGPPAAGGRQPVGGGPQALHSSPPEGDRV